MKLDLCWIFLYFLRIHIKFSEPSPYPSFDFEVQNYRKNLRSICIQLCSEYTHCVCYVLQVVYVKMSEKNYGGVSSPPPTNPNFVKIIDLYWSVLQSSHCVLNFFPKYSGPSKNSQPSLTKDKKNGCTFDMFHVFSLHLPSLTILKFASAWCKSLRFSLKMEGKKITSALIWRIGKIMPLVIRTSKSLRLYLDWDSVKFWRLPLLGL